MKAYPMYDAMTDMIVSADFLPTDVIESGVIEKGVMNITLRSTVAAEKVVFWIEHELPTTQEARFRDGGIQLFHAASNEVLSINLTKLN